MFVASDLDLNRLNRMKSGFHARFLKVLPCPLHRVPYRRSFEMGNAVLVNYEQVVLDDGELLAVARHDKRHVNATMSALRTHLKPRRRVPRVFQSGLSVLGPRPLFGTRKDERPSTLERGRAVMDQESELVRIAGPHEAILYDGIELVVKTRTEVFAAAPLEWNEQLPRFGQLNRMSDRDVASIDAGYVETVFLEQDGAQPQTATAVEHAFRARLFERLAPDWSRSCGAPFRMIGVSIMGLPLCTAEPLPLPDYIPVVAGVHGEPSYYTSLHHRARTLLNGGACRMYRSGSGMLAVDSAPMDLTLYQWILGGCATLFIGFSKTGMPGAGIIVVPLLAEALGARRSVGTMLPLLIFSDLFAVAWYRRHAKWDRILGLIPWVAVGMAAGVLALKALGEAHGPQDRMNQLIGILVLLMLGLRLAQNRMGGRITPHSRGAVAVVGAGAGFTTTASNAAGPIMAIYMQAMELPKTEFMGTTAWFFFLVNVAKLPLFIALSYANPANPLVDADTIRTCVALAPFAALGAVLGRRLLPWIPQRAFDGAVQALAALAAARLILR